MSASPEVDMAKKIPLLPPVVRDHVLFQNAGLKLVVGSPPEDAYNITVSPQVLQLASPVWSAMLDRSRGWQESRMEAVPLPDDDPEALLLLLRIAHLKFEAVPGSCSFDVILKVAVLCDKYDTVQLVRPYILQWISQARGTINVATFEEWLFIAWTFGMTETFEVVAKELVLNTKRDESDKGLVTASGRSLEANIYMPPGAIDSINEVREATLQRIERICLDYVNRFNHGTVCKEASIDQSRCDAIVYGSLVRGLHAYLPLSSNVSSVDMVTSIKELAGALTSLNVYTFPNSYTESLAGFQKAYHHSPAHNRCDIGVELRQELKNILSTIPSPVLTSHKEHMRRQREKCGTVEVITAQ